MQRGIQGRQGGPWPTVSTDEVRYTVAGEPCAYRAHFSCARELRDGVEVRDHVGAQRFPLLRFVYFGITHKLVST